MSERVRGALWAYLNLAVLWTFAVAQPLFDLLKDNPEFFAARGSTGFDIVSFSVLLVVLPPLLLLGVELLIGLAGEPARRGAHAVLIGGLVALIAVQALKKAFDTSDVVLIVLSVAIGIGLAVLWLRAEVVRSFLNVLSPAPLVFFLLFLFSGSISELAFPNDAKARTIGGVTQAPIVMVLLDELPTNTLVDAEGNLDRERFPGFAELARSATWYENAYTVYDSTERAQPAIMDGNLPEEDKQPISGDHPNSIFSLFGKTHRMNVSEEATSVCSPELCEDERQDESYGDRLSSMTEDLGLVWLHVVAPPEIESDLTSVSENWGNFGAETTGSPDPAKQGGTLIGRSTRRNLNGGRPIRFQEWLEEIRRGGKPGLNFKHTLLPHVPWQYLPGGTRYRRQPNDAISGLSNRSYEDQGQLDVLLQRHILQTMFADSQLQRLWRKLKAEGLWDDALIVVAADHGVSFPKRFERRRLDREHAAEIAPVPALHQGAGPGGGRGRRRLGRDDRHPAHDLRRARARPEGGDGREARLERRGAGSRRAALPGSQHVRGGAHPRRRDRGRAAGGDRPQPASLRLRRRRPVPHRPEPGPDRQARLGGRRAARRRVRLRPRVRAGRPGEGLRARPRGGHGGWPRPPPA